MENELLESAQKFRTITEQSFMGIAVMQDHKITFVNKKLSDIFGYTIEEMLNWKPRRVYQIIHPEDVENVMPIVERKYRGDIKEIKELQFRIIKKNGEIIWIEIFSRTVLYKGKEADLVSFFDITEQKEAENKLKESEEKYRTLFNEANDAIFLMDKEKVIGANRATLKIFGFSEISKFLGLTPYELSPKIQPDGQNSKLKTLKIVKEVLEENSKRFYWKLRRKDGTLFDSEVSANKITIEGKNYIQAIVRDISQQKKIEQELIKLNKFKSKMLTRISHELKTPLLSIKGFTELLKLQFEHQLNGDMLEIIEEIKKGCNRLESLVKAILSSAELESSDITLNKELVDLNEIILKSIKDLDGFIKSRNQCINFTLEQKIKAFIDKEQIYNVLNNLITNAVKYTPSNGTIKINSHLNGTFVIVSVEDTGIGLTKHEKSKIFQRFGKIERFGQGYDVISEGSGLGLYYSKEIIELHGGRIWVESKGRNKGSKFSFSLPL
ncbi:MAG: Histidine kinase [Promethearchaeota archaeon]|nr:MAG: Histidine kinase [Candidatus Lokiarchaeota archaeon]